MKKIFFTQLSLFIINIFGFVSFSLANIIIYNSQGKNTEIAYSFPLSGESPLDFTTNDVNQKQQHIESVISFLTSFEDFPFKLTQDSIHTVRFTSMRNLGEGSFALRFSYDLDLSKINNLLPNKVSLISKNILVRVKNGYIESIATGIEKNISAIVYNKMKTFTYLHLNNTEKFDQEKIKNTFINLIKFLKKEDNHYKILTQLVLENKAQFLLYLKQSLQQANSAQLSLAQLLKETYRIFSPITRCGEDCSKEVIELKNFLKNLGLKEDIKIDEIMEEWVSSNISKLNFMNIIFKELLKEKTIYFHLDTKNNFHLIVQKNGTDPQKINLSIGTEGIKFTKIRMESHVNDLKLIETKKFVSVISNNNANEKTETISFDSFENLIGKRNNGSLDSEQDYISLFILNNLKYYKDHLMFERKIANKPIVIHYGINEPSSRAENASWAYFPIEKFYIGSGGNKFTELGKQADILGHEFFHFAEESLSNLYSSNESGALKEHGGDILGMIVSENLNKKIDDQPAFAIGCNIFTNEAIEKKKAENSDFNYNQNLGLDNICLRNYLKPKNSFSPQATTKSSIQYMLGENYQTECEDTPDNDSCGLHFQASIPNLVVSEFMGNAKKMVPSLKWGEIRNLTAKIVFNTYAGRLQSDAGFLTYGQQLKLECLEQSKSILPQQNASSLCNQIEDKFIEILK